MQHFHSFVTHVISLLLSPRFGGVRPFPLAMQHFYSFVVSHVISLLLSPRFAAGIRPFPLAMQHFYSFDFFTFVSHVQCLHCWCPAFSAGHAAFLSICFPADFASVRGSQCFVRVSALLWDWVSCLPSCWSLCLPCSLLSPFVSLLVSLLVGHCVRIVSLLSPFVW